MLHYIFKMIEIDGGPNNIKILNCLSFYEFMLNYIFWWILKNEINKYNIKLYRVQTYEYLSKKLCDGKICFFYHRKLGNPCTVPHKLIHTLL